MNYRVLGVLGVMALMVATWFFYQEETKIKPALPQVASGGYEVTKIQAVQTSPETGQTEYTLDAKSLIQNAQGEDEMMQIQMQWHPPQGEKFLLSAEKAKLQQQTGDLLLENGFQLVRQSSDKPKLIINGERLMGNTKNRTVHSRHTLLVQQGDHQFKAAAFSADLQTGEYTFDKVEMLFWPPKTQ